MDGMLEKLYVLCRLIQPPCHGPLWMGMAVRVSYNHS